MNKNILLLFLTISFSMMSFHICHCVAARLNSIIQLDEEGRLIYPTIVFNDYKALKNAIIDNTHYQDFSLTYTDNNGELITINADANLDELEGKLINVNRIEEID